MTEPQLRVGPNRQKGRWHIEVNWPDGRRTRHLTKTPLDEDPAAALESFRLHALPAIEPAPSAPRSKQGPLIRDLIDWYLTTHLPYTQAKKKTIEYYQSTLYNFLSYCQMQHISRTAQLSSRVIQEWQKHCMDIRGTERPSREQILQVRRWLQVCQDCGEIKEMPDIAWHVPPKRKGKQHRAHPREAIDEWLAGLAAWRPRVHAVAQWVDATGWRIGDALDLRVGEVDLTAGWIDREQIKTSEALPYPITPRLRELLQDAMKRRKRPGSRDHVFLNHRGQPWEYPAIYRVLCNYNESHWDGDAITFRDLRKSFGSHLAMAGCPPNVLQQLMGHSDVTMTLGYYVQVDRAAMEKWSEVHTGK